MAHRTWVVLTWRCIVYVGEVAEPYTEGEAK